jgi:hypothetical protein
MNSGLLILLMVTGALALYWILFGQWKHNRMMREAQEKSQLTKNKKTNIKNN